MQRERAKLLWRCRRGMRELDLLLTRFMQHGFDALPASDRAAFERLLECTDQEILAWITGNAAPPDAALERIVTAIRRTRETSGPHRPPPLQS
ncbi:MAG: succinate dehydrogenase assembly factor 2 [Gammaproteobacteria bacterium]|nr:succinate dehydrogenase assembly factor 2 [Gammaproteobacteria bacterium]NIR85463.1 succinate dehydrogenase assembly factor 2 [Gammaproteobacteria bacterium]NIR89515.1 succinate dehydrogenase assembly factor 2 [Gammaproteobacteria bacterium]NIU06600.1 succinate dehydrogenase assembly factor 2 [Gammaproteobacteria bacterium]NIV53483.1 hypothetical protein [Gammaproteobacteria bacterium]